MNKPNVPYDVKIADKDESPGLSTHELSEVKIEAKVKAAADDPGQVRMVVYLSGTKDFAKARKHESDYGADGVKHVSFAVDENTHYYYRIYAQQRNLDRLSDYNSGDFWSERPPKAPRLDGPKENVTFEQGEDVHLLWKHQDADDHPEDPQVRFQVRYRIPQTSTKAAGDWVTYTSPGGDTSGEYVIDGAVLRANEFYEWEVRTRDTHSSFWGDWAIRSFYVLGATRAPLPTSPVNDIAVSVDQGVHFEWEFRDPSGGAHQVSANLRYRVAGVNDTLDGGWTTIDTAVTGSDEFYDMAGDILQPGYRYAWCVQTKDDNTGQVSDWSDPVHFYSILTPGWASGVEVIGPTVPQGVLGNGEYRVMVCDRGGERIAGEVTPLATFQWGRVRDDISSALLTTNGFGDDCCALLSSLRTWVHELVVYRNGVRVWEGPITRLSFFRNTVEIEAKDPMVYVYRRIMRQGYNDTYRKHKGQDVGARTVVDRAAIIIANALAPNDPNVLPWLTRFDFDDDAKEARSVPDWSKTAWEEVDDLAATGGLDYTVVGRRIILNDVHRPIGRVAELREGDFFDPPVIAEYGMSAANIFGVTNNAGLYGEYEIDRDEWGDAGPIEQLASAYGEAANGGAPSTSTPNQQAQHKRDLDKQAARNLNGRWPPPVVARVPDGDRLHPNANIDIAQLIPGVHIPLRVSTLCREFAQMQKLDSINVSVENGQELVAVTMAPAPRAGLDPDADPTDGGDA